MGAERSVGNIVGNISERELVNSWVVPDEVSPLLPTGLLPHVGTNGGVVAGCGMIEIAAARPWPTPRLVGVALRAAAHRISVEVGPVDQPTLAVYVPVRHTDSRSAILAGRGVRFAHSRLSTGSQCVQGSVVGGVTGEAGKSVL